MRQFERYIKTTLKEDKECFRALVQAMEAGPDDHHLRVLATVKKYLLDRNGELTMELYQSFLALLRDLDVTLPTMQINRRDPEAGSWYPIPSRGSYHKGQSHEERLAHRSDARHKRWNSVVEGSSFTEAELEVLLAGHDTQLAEIREVVIKEVNDLEAEIETALLALHGKIDEMSGLLTKVAKRVDAIEQDNEAIVGAIELLEANYAPAVQPSMCN